MVDYWVKDMTRIDWIRGRVSFGDSILEVGCDTNDVWKDTPFKVTTLDINPEVNPDVVASAESLPFTAGSFDVVCIDEVLEHLEDPHKAITEALRVGRKKVIVTVPWEQAWDKKNLPFKNPNHIRYYNPRVFESLMLRTGHLYQIDILKFGGLYWIGAEILVPTKNG